MQSRLLNNVFPSLLYEAISQRQNTEWFDERQCKILIQVEFAVSPFPMIILTLRADFFIFAVPKQRTNNAAICS
jgi:hypothetical protein